MSGRVIYLPLEVFTREYLGKLSLAIKLLQHEREVVIGYNHLVRAHALESDQDSVFYEIKGKSQKDMGHLAQLRKKGICLVGQDEEAGISYLNFSDFEVLRPEVQGVMHFESFFAWGEEDFNAYNRNQKLDSVIKTGSPRTVHWGSHGAQFYQENILRIREQFGEFVLLVSNLGSRNNIWTEKEMQKYARNSGYENSYDLAAKNRMLWEEKAFQSTLRIIDTILESTKMHIVIRPHPNENITAWKEYLQGNPRITISKSGDSIPNILASKQVIHSGSTVGLEALLCGVPTISFENLIASNSGVPMTSNEFSLKINSMDELISYLHSGRCAAPEQDFFEVMKKKLTKYDDVTVLDNQVQIIHEINFNKKIRIPLENKSPLDKIMRSRIYQRLKYGKSSYLEIHRNKRPIILLEKIKKDSHKLLNQFEIEHGVKITELGESTFSIKRY